MRADEWNFIIAAYAVAWVVLLGYAGYVHAVARRARAEWRGTRDD